MKPYKNVLGTTSFTHKFQGLRKEQDFCVCQTYKRENNTVITIQSHNRYAEIDVETGEGTMCAHREQYATSAALMIDTINKCAVKIKLEPDDLKQLLDFTKTTKDSNKPITLFGE
jgi:ribosomal protein S11